MFGGIEGGSPSVGPAGEKFSPRERLRWIFVAAVVTAAVSATFYVGAQVLLGNANTKFGPTPASSTPANSPASTPASTVTTSPNQAATPANSTIATPEPTPAPAALAGAADLSGKVPRQMPGVRVGSGARITSILETGGVYCEYYAIDLRLEQTLVVTVTQPGQGHGGPVYYISVKYALPGLGYQHDDWTDAYGPVLAGTDGSYSIRVCDYTMGAGTFYQYGIDFSVH